jgi:hypothetical protein
MNAQYYWGDLMNQFEGTDKSYDFWIDMNEPSVFDNAQMTLPLTS